MEDTEITQISHESNRNNFRLRCTASQCLVALATNIVKFSFGTLFGFNALITAELLKDDAEIVVTKQELSWFTSYYFMVPIGCVLVGVFAQSIGSRKELLIGAATYTAAWLIFYYATNSTMLLCAQILVAVSYSVPFVPGTSYIAEISQPHLRNPLMASTNLCVLGGIFLTLLLGSLIYWRSVALVNFGISILGFIAMCFIPESPLWLASKNRFDEAELALAWLRGWVTPAQIQSEFCSLKTINQNKLNDVNDISRRKNYINLKKICNFKEIFKPYFHRTFYMPLIIICYMFFVYTMFGSKIITIYSIYIFKIINSPIDENIAAVILQVLRILGACICVSVIHYTGKKQLMLISLVGTGFSFLLISIFLLLMQHEIILTEKNIWVPTIALLAANFFSSAGIDKIVYMFNVELFPTKFRNVGAGLGLFFCTIFDAILSKLFYYIIDAITLSGVFFTFFIFTIISVITFYFIFPETSGRTLKEIEDHYAGIKSLKNQPAKKTDQKQVES